MASAAQNVAAFAAEGDLEQQGTQRQNPARSPWLKLLYKGLREIISLMPEALENNRIVNGMCLGQDDDALVDFSKAFITSKQTELEIKYPNLQPILDFYDKDPAAGDRSHLDAFFPDLNKKKAWIASDSVLHLYIPDKPKEFRKLTEQWRENSRVWKILSARLCLLCVVAARCWQRSKTAQ